MTALFLTDGPKTMMRPIAETPLAQTDVTISVDPTKKYQSIDGFGASFTDASASLVDHVLDDSTREEVMTKLFNPHKGIGLSLLRNPIGASDYARSIYSFDDMPKCHEDREFAHFSLAHDEESILPLTKWAMKLNPQLKLISSPWSAPGWMKTSGSMIGGRLRKDCYAAYAEYLVRFLKAYEQHGVHVYAITPQNEPLYVPPHYPGMLLPAAQEARFVRDFLRPALREAGLTTRVFGYDHNWDRADYPHELLEEAGEAFDGIAWHWYAGKASSQSLIAQQFPGKDVYFTEGSGGEWIPEFEPAFSNLMRNGIDILRNGSKSFILWNIALDEHNGPVVPGFGRSTCRGLVRINRDQHSVEYTLDYYGLAHFSTYIRPGATRVESTESAGIKSVAFTNTDGSTVLVVFNDSRDDVRLRMQMSHNADSFGADSSHADSSHTALVPSHAALTLVLKSENEH